jgi:hypothetical protein
MATSPMNAHTRMLARNGERQSSAYGSSASKIATRATARARTNLFGTDMRRRSHDRRGSFVVSHLGDACQSISVILRACESFRFAGPMNGADGLSSTQERISGFDVKWVWLTVCWLGLG